MRRAIISDIHGNLAAFNAVLADIEAEKVDEIFCLGDVVGYGPDPRKCLEMARGFRVNLLGNHEEAVLFAPVGFNPKAREAIDWTREQLNLSSEPIEANRELWNFLGSLERIHKEENVLFVHGSPREPVREYIFTSDIQEHQKMDEIFAASPKRVCFVGHTHIPGVFTEDYQFFSPSSLNYEYSLDGTMKVIVNVGSIGQPRDGDPRACYAIYDGEMIRYRRVEYDIRDTIRRFSETDLPGYLALRLEEGK